MEMKGAIREMDEPELDADGNPICRRCGGAREIEELDVSTATREKVACPSCNGTGVEGGKLVNGMAIRYPVCDIAIMQQLKGGEPVATLELWVYRAKRGGRAMTITGENGMKMIASFAEIHHMHTRGKWRRKGLMKELVAWAMAQPLLFLPGVPPPMGVHFIAWLVTDWHDSSEAGRATLQSLGFKRDESRLIWWREGVPNDYYADDAQPEGSAD